MYINICIHVCIIVYIILHILSGKYAYYVLFKILHLMIKQYTTAESIFDFFIVIYCYFIVIYLFILLLLFFDGRMSPWMQIQPEPNPKFFKF